MLRRVLTTCVVVLVLVAVGLTAWKLSAHRSVSPTPVSTSNVWSLQDVTSQHPVIAFKPGTPDALASLSTGQSLVAKLPHAEPGYNKPGGRAVRTVPGSWWGYVSELPVIGETPGWLDVRLAQRPNQSTSWIRSTGVKLSTTDYEIVVNLKTTHLELLKSGNVVDDFPAGVGSSEDPTPEGNYFVAFYAPPPAGQAYLYGPWVMFTSAHSDAIEDWEGTGDAMIAIHGPIGADAEIGTTGTQISHGCVRLHMADQLKLAMVPPGSPIDIVD
ncbi:MAG: L,D-transpeptidase [Acidimicrobiales bacterium]